MKRILLSAAIAMMLLVSSASAQTAPVRVWISSGVVISGSRYIEMGVGLSGQLAVEKRPHHVSARAIIFGDVGGFPDSGGGDGVGEAGLVYGRMITGVFGQAFVAAGLSAIQFEGCPGTQEDSCGSLGVPIVAQAGINSRIVGFAVQGFANVNPKSIYGGISIVLQLGWMP